MCIRDSLETSAKCGLAKLRHRTRRNIFSRELVRSLALGRQPGIVYDEEVDDVGTPRALTWSPDGQDIAIGDNLGIVVRISSRC